VFLQDSCKRYNLSDLLASSRRPRGDARDLLPAVAVAAAFALVVAFATRPLAAWLSADHGSGVVGHAFKWSALFVGFAAETRWTPWAARGVLALVVGLALHTRLWRDATFAATVLTVAAVAGAILVAVPLLLSISMLFLCFVLIGVVIAIFIVLGALIIVFIAIGGLSDL